MVRFSLVEILLSFVIIIGCIVSLYLIAKQFGRLITFGKDITYFKEKDSNKINKIIALFTVIILVPVYIFFTFRNINLDILLAEKYNFYDMIKFKYILKWSLNFIPMSIVFFWVLFYLPKECISSKGIVSDKLAIKWDEIKRVDKDDNVLKIYYNYKIIFFKLNFSYIIHDESGEICEIVNRYLE